MANYRAVFSVGNSLARFLDNNYPADLSANFPCHFRLVSSAEIATEEQHALDQVVTIFLHRITTNEHFRGATRLQDGPARQPMLYLDLHYLVTYWGTSAEAEQVILAWTMLQLQGNLILDRSILSADAGWDTTETVQIIPADLSLEDILRIWDALGPKYRLSVSYVARVVRIDRSIAAEAPVAATRFTLQDMGGNS